MVILYFFRRIRKIKKFFLRRFYTFIVKTKAERCDGRIAVNYRSSVTSRTRLGNNVNFNGMTISGRGQVSIGDNFHSGTNCQIMSDYHNYDCGKKIPYDDTFIVQDVTIEDNVWFGNNVIVLSGVCIGEGAIIQAGSVVVSNVPPLAIAGGHPARVFKYRNKEHYYQMKQENRFH